MAKKHTFWFVTCLLIFQITALAEDTSAPVNARQVMSKFVESQKKLKSYIIKSNTKATFSYTGFNKNRPGTTYRHSDVRFDGDRVKESLTHWGDQGHRILDLPKENAEYTSCLWDGETGYSLSLYDKIRQQTAKHPGLVQIYKKGSRYADYAKETYKRTMISPAQGYVMGNDQDIGTMFLRADAKVKLLDKRSKVNGVDCYVIEAEVPKRGKYKVWIDPVHDFNLARLQSRRKTGDLYYGRPLNEDVHWNNFYEVVEFQEVKGVWLPKTFKTKANGHDGGYDFDHQEETQTELYEVNLDPDHHKEGSFLTDDILNGTQVRLEGIPLKVILTWQDGEVVDKHGNKIDKMAEDVLVKKATANNSVSLDKILAESTSSSSYLLDRLTENLNSLESVIITTETTSQGSNTPDMKKIGKKSITSEEFRTDGNRTRRIMKIWGSVLNSDLEKKDAIHKSGLWDGENYYQYDYAKHMPDSPVPNGRVHITPKSLVSKFDNDSTITTRSSINSVGGEALGYFSRDDNRIDHILRTSQDVKVKDQKVQIGDSLCFVLEAETYTGKYEIYLDPERNYSIAKLQNIKTAGDKAFTYGYELRGQDKVYYTYETKKFKNVDGQWVASKSESICKRRMHDGSFQPASKTNVNTTGFVLNPDHEAMNSFVPDDIRDGALVSVVGKTEIAYTWQNGELIPR